MNPVSDPQSLLEIIEDLSDSDERKIEFFKLLKNRKKKQCGKCGNLVFNSKSCEFCIRKSLEDNFSKWKSGNEKIDELIQTCQKNTIRPDAIIEWIPFEHLKNIQSTAEGNLFKIYNAIWTKGRFVNWDQDRQKLKRNTEAVTIKHIGVNPDSDQWYQEIRTHLSLSASISPIILSYGLTQETESTNYMIVMESVKNTLKSYLQDTSFIKKELTWIQKYRILLDISSSLESIHDKQLVCRGLNPGNIMFSNRMERWLIGDFGLCRSVNFILNEVQGIIPYSAPEILKVKMDKTNQTSVCLDLSSDIYSFGMIMWEISTTHQPFKGRHHNLDLITKIINNNERPEVMAGTPSKYSELMEKCWSADVLERPSIKDIQDEIKNVLNDYNKKNMPLEEMDLMNKVHFLETATQYEPFIADNDDDPKPNPGTPDQEIEIIIQDKIRNEEISDGIGLISYATLVLKKEIKEVAIKSLKIDNSSNLKNEFYLKSLQQRINEMGVFSHLNIVEFLGLGIKDEDKLFFVMPRANGSNLRIYYNENKSLPFDKKIEIAKGIARGIMKLHDHNIIHENLNPENILMFGETPKISNLPLPYKKNVEFYFKNKEYYFDNSLFSVIGYVDPNYFFNKGIKKNKSVDVYSFGSLLWEILSERVPYSEESDLILLVRNISDNNFREEDIPDVSDEINNLIKKCWEKDGSARGTIHDVYNMLE